MILSKRLKFVKGQQSKLLKKFIKTNNLSISSAAKLLGISKTNFKQWLREKYTLPENIFFAICKNTPKLKKYSNKIELNLKSNWGRIKGGKSRIKKIENVNLFYKNLRMIKNKKRLEKSLSNKKRFKVKNRILLSLLKDNVNLKYILATCLLTDGSLTKDGGYRIGYYTNDPILKNFIYELLFVLSKFTPSIYRTIKGLYCIRVNDNYLAKELFRLSPSYKKAPQYYESKYEYLNKVQPSFKFLERADRKTMIWCIRFAFTADGCITISKNKTIELNFACYHPTLAKQWLDLIKTYGLSGHLGIDKSSWCEIDGVRIYDSKSIKNFNELGGFIPGVKVSNKSKRFKGLEKNTVLKIAIRARSLPLY